MTKKIDVQNWNGETLRVTKQEYLDRWMEDIYEFNKLVENNKDSKTYTKLVMTAISMVNEKFDRLYERQNK